jgi:toxin ParE1/3/4
VRRTSHISDAAADELTAGVRWYESQRLGLGADLFDAVSATIERIEQQPEIGATAQDDRRTRRALVERFPYQVVYRLDQDEILIVAIAHLKRRPGYWKHRD